MSEPWNKWYPHDIDTWQGSGNIQALSDTGYRAVHNIMQDMWKQEDCSLPCDQKVLRRASRVVERWDSCQEEVMDYFDRLGDGSVTNNVLRGKWMKAKEVYEARQNAAKKTNKTKPNHAPPSKAPRSAKQSDPIAPRSADTLTVTDTVTTTKKEQKPSRDKREVDPRHVVFKEEIERYTAAKGVLFVWDVAEASQLSLLLKAVPQLAFEDFKRCLMNRARSPGTTHGERPRVWLPHILKYQEAPLNEFGKTGIGNGNRNSKTGGNITAAAGAFAILEQAERNSNPADEVQPETGSRGKPGDLSHLRAGSLEL